MLDLATRHPTRDLEAQTLSRVFVDHAEPLQTCSVRSPVEDAVPRPHLILSLSLMSNAAMHALAQSTLFSLLFGNVEAFLTPQPVHAIKSRLKPFSLKKPRDPAIAEPGWLSNKLAHPFRQMRGIA